VPSPGAAGKTGNEAPICHGVPASSIYSHRCGQSYGGRHVQFLCGVYIFR
jgi:hypothetical protein